MTVDIEKLKALALAATPGPWEWWTSNSVLRLTGADGKDGGVLCGYVHSGDGDVYCSDANRAFIATANPAAVAELIAEVERLRSAPAAQARQPAAPADDAQDASRLADGYESGFFASSPQDGDGQFTLHYKTAAQAEAAYMLVTGIIDAAMSTSKREGDK
jgi:hypothetical protein